MFGGLALNKPVGGINPYAVDSALKLGAKIIWLPTNTAENHLRREHKSGGVAVVRDGKVVPELETVFSLIKDHDAVLATGHSGPEECFIVAEAARKAGVKKIVITHPEFWIVGMSVDDQVRIVNDYDVILEKVYASPIGAGIYRKNYVDNANVMRLMGSKNIIVATDSGQKQNPYWYDSYTEYVTYLHQQEGISQEDIDRMTKTTPAWLLGLGERV